MNDLAIDYEALLRDAGTSDLEGVIRHLSEELPYEWHDRYCAMTPTKTNVRRINLPNFEYLFDFSSELTYYEEVPEEEAVTDRIVAIFGRSEVTTAKRDASRIRGFLGGPLAPTADGPSDKGHFMGHSLGGGLDINLFPQRRDINQGRSERGKVFRAMERHCAANGGTFCFSRPIYRDKSWRPHSFEYGVLQDASTLWIERFEN